MPIEDDAAYVATLRVPAEQRQWRADEVPQLTASALYRYVPEPDPLISASELRKFVGSDFRVEAAGPALTAQELKLMSKACKAAGLPGLPERTTYNNWGEYLEAMNANARERGWWAALIPPPRDPDADERLMWVLVAEAHRKRLKAMIADRSIRARLAGTLEDAGSMAIDLGRLVLTLSDLQKFAAALAINVIPTTGPLPSETDRDRGNVRHWLDATLRANYWLSLPMISATDAALLLCRYDPDEKDAIQKAEAQTSHEVSPPLTPEDFKRLRRAFQALQPAGSMGFPLVEWAHKAKTNGWRFDPWLDEYMASAAGESADGVVPIEVFDVPPRMAELPPRLGELDPNEVVELVHPRVDYPARSRQKAAGAIVELQAIIDRQAKDYFTLQEVALVLAAANSLSAAKFLRERLLPACRSRELRAYSMSDMGPADPACIRDTEDCIRPTELDAWLDANGFAYSWPSDHSAPTAAERPNSLDYTVLADDEDLVAAFGLHTGCTKDWFSAESARNSPALRAARKHVGKGGRGGDKSLFCPYEVMNWLVSNRKPQAKPFHLTAGWMLLKRHFPRAYKRHAHADPTAQ